MAIPENRVDIRNKIRARLSAWPDDVGTIAEVLDSTEVGVDLSGALDISEKALVEIDSEVMRVRAYTAGSSTITSVIRGDRGSTAAAHADLSAISVYPFWGWTNFDINREIDCALDWLWPDVWVLTAKTNTFLANNTDFGLPPGSEYPNGDIVKRIELLDDTVTPNIYRQILGWKHLGDRIILSKPTKKDYSVRIWTQGRHIRLVSDSAQLASSDPVEAIVYYACSNLLEQLLANRVRYVEYSAALNDRASTPDELQRQSYYFKNQAVVARDRVSRPGLSGFASTRRS